MNYIRFIQNFNGWKYLLYFIVFTPLLYFRDFTPNNELKYLSIINETLANGNFFTFTNHGIPYADKPPFYFWFIMAGKLIWNEHYMFFLGLFSLLPAFVILYIMDRWTHPLLNSQQRNSAQLSLLTTGLFLGAALILRMDMLMCMFIVLALYTFFRIYKRTNSRIEKYLLPLYIFLALFTKGPVGLLIPFLAIITFLSIKKEIRYFSRYFGIRQWTILLGLCGLWFLGVYLESGSNYLYNLLFHQTVNRAIDSFHHKEPFYYYFQTIWYTVAPWSLFFIFTLCYGLWKKRLTTDLERYFLVILSIILFSLSVFSSKLDIYLLPAFPFLAYLPALLLPKINLHYIKWTLIIPATLLVFAFPVVYLGSPQVDIPLTNNLTIAAGILSLSGIIALVFLFTQRFYKAINSIAIGLLLTIFTASFALPRYNSYIGFRKISDYAQQIARQHQINQYYFYKFRSGENMDVFLGEKIQKTDLSKLKKLSGQESFILFIRNKDLKRSQELQKITDNKPSYEVGNYRFFLFSVGTSN